MCGHHRGGEGRCFNRIYARRYACRDSKAFGHLALAADSCTCRLEYVVRALAVELQPTSLPPLRFNVKRDDLCHASISVSISLLGAPIYSADR
ncbi:hypothetical protein FA13DRAFT_1745139, partial [Coprinellus micaceus]